MSEEKISIIPFKDFNIKKHTKLRALVSVHVPAGILLPAADVVLDEKSYVEVFKHRVSSARVTGSFVLVREKKRGAAKVIKARDWMGYVDKVYPTYTHVVRDEHVGKLEIECELGVYYRGHYRDAAYPKRVYYISKEDFYEFGMNMEPGFVVTSVIRILRASEAVVQLFAPELCIQAEHEAKQEVKYTAHHEIPSYMAKNVIRRLYPSATILCTEGYCMSQHYSKLVVLGRYIAIRRPGDRMGAFKLVEEGLCQRKLDILLGSDGGRVLSDTWLVLAPSYNRNN